MHLSEIPRCQVVQVSAVNVNQHLRGRDLAQIAERTVGSTLEMILHHVRAHLLVVEALQAADLARVVHLRWFAGRHFQGVRGSGLSNPFDKKFNIIREIKDAARGIYRDRRYKFITG